MLLLLLWVLGMLFSLRHTSAQSATQPDAHVTVSEKNRLELRCNYSYGATPNLFWYMQYPNQRLQLLLKFVSGRPNALEQGIRGFEAEFRKNETSFHLRKQSAHWRDTAMYFCAASDTVPGATGGAEHKPLEALRRLSAPERFWTLT
uniref:Ig-like domain-containing protein n=1 Tax=Suricata suricatta TaxID=37032 RepID=A0A673TJR5_SURSU